MGLFDAIREKAGELLGGATEQVGDLAGNVPGASDVQDLSQSATDVAGQANEQVTGAAQDLGATATDLSGSATDAAGNVTDAAGNVTGSLPDMPEPYRP